LKLITDFHIHSHFSIATSKKLIPEYLQYFGRLKGINIIGTGDCIHPGWTKELQQKLEPVENGLFKLKKEYHLQETKDLQGDNIPDDVYFMLTGELSSIYKRDGKVRKVHNLAVFPDFESLSKVQNKLDSIGNIRSDGRPILGIDSRDILEMVLTSNDHSFLIPAHIWTPWFSVLGSKSGFDSIEECYGDLTSEIFALETGLSSDPAMNWACSFLDRFQLVSNSDAHSPEKLGREANLFNIEAGYQNIYNSLKSGEGFLGTIEFFPEEGKYHLDGHRKCGIRWNPMETLDHDAICPVCGKEVTKGVMYRVAELADRKIGKKAPHRKDFKSITQLQDIIKELLGIKSASAKKVVNEYHRLIQTVGSEFHLLLDAPLDQLKEAGGEVFGEGIRRLREGEVTIDDGYDGEFGSIKVFNGIKEKDFSVKKNKSSRELHSNEDFNIESFKKKLPERDTIEKRTAIDKSLSDMQQIAIEHFKGPAMVTAGPGTGKTYILIERIKYIIDHHNVLPESIIALAFSNRAAREMREKLSSASQYNGVIAATFHIFGLSILRDHFEYFQREVDFRLLDDEERLQICDKIDAKKSKKILQSINEYKEQLIPPKYEEEYLKYEEMLKELNAFDVPDLIFKVNNLLEENNSIKEKYQNKIKWILVDEFQDANEIQYQLLKKIAQHGDRNIFILSDPDQSIYGFRDVLKDASKKLKNDFPLLKNISLDGSYRCPQFILHGAADVIEKKKSLDGYDSGAKLQVHQSLTDKAEAEWIASTIELLLGGTRTSPGDSTMSTGDDEYFSLNDFAILCRSSFMFGSLVKALSDHNVSSIVYDNRSWFSQYPTDVILKKMKEAYFGESADDSMVIIELFEKEMPCDTIISEIAALLNIEDYVILPLVDFSLQFESNYDRFFREILLNGGVDSYRKGTGAVSIMTIHGSKGLEFPCVFVPGCEEGILPFSLFNNSHIAEEERLFYVAMTRSSRRLFLTSAKKRYFKGRVLESKESSFVQRIRKKILDVTTDVEEKHISSENQLDLFS